MKFDANPDNINELFTKFQLNKDVVRPMVIQLEEEYMRPCELGQECIFGETPLEYANRKSWRTSALKKTRRYESRK